MTKSVDIKIDVISPLAINGLDGRVLKMPATKKTAKREILLVYGHHSSIERMYGIAEYLTAYGNVTMPDLPGFGGMDSFYKIGEKPTIDNLADYLATFVKLNYRDKHIVIGAMSFGFVVVTRMLQKYPKLVEQVDVLFSLAGFSHHQDFKLKKRTIWTFKIVAWLFSGYLSAAFVKYLILKKPLIKLTYILLDRNNPKIKDAGSEERRKCMNFEVILWQKNDIRTYMHTTTSMMHLDLTSQKINAPVVSIAVDSDIYFDNSLVQEHLKQIYTGVKICRTELPNHAPTVISNAAEVEAFFTKAIQRELNKAPRY
jgi:pimeloyl-ACP methyl ester carboxylesterase